MVEKSAERDSFPNDNERKSLIKSLLHRSYTYCYTGYEKISDVIIWWGEYRCLHYFIAVIY